MPRFAISRRTVLRGAAGAALALPPLEIMSARTARAAASAIPKRFCMSYAGVAHGCPGVAVADSLVLPRKVGRDYELTRGLLPFRGDTVCKGTADADSFTSVKGEVGIVSGLMVPFSTDPAVPPPPAGWGPGSFHGSTTFPQTAGKTSSIAGGSGEHGAPTADQIVADAFAGTTPLPSLYVRAQAAMYSTQDSGFNALSFSNGKPIDPIVSLRQAYGTLFSAGGAANGQTVDVASVIDRRKSILDLVTEKSRRLLARLGGEDRARVESYYQQIRSLETTLQGLKAVACKPPASPQDPPIADGYDPQSAKHPYDVFESPAQGWSDEELRAKVLADFVHLALACNLTRSVVYQLTLFFSKLNAYHITASNTLSDLHYASHLGNATDMAEIVAWHGRHFARLVAKLRDTVEVDGSRVLDHCAMSMLFEGGHGPGAVGEPVTSHSTMNMIALVAGRAGGLEPGQHIRFNNDRHPAQVVLSHMNAVDVHRPLGDISQPLPELFSRPA